MGGWVGGCVRAVCVYISACICAHVHSVPVCMYAFTGGHLFSLAVMRLGNFITLQVKRYKTSP